MIALSDIVMKFYSNSEYKFKNDINSLFLN